MSQASKSFLKIIVIFFVVLVMRETLLKAIEPESVDVFISGTDGYHTCRVPSVVCTPKGTLLAFCEGRKFNGLDQSPGDILLKRSTDGGKTWLPMQVAVKAVPETAMDPTPVIDQTTGAVVLVYDLWPEYIKDTWPADYKRAPGLGRNSVTGWVTTSTDEGATWSTPINITATTKRPAWAVIVHGPGVGIQTRSGRLVIPCWRTSPNALEDMHNYAIFSDDHGINWQLSDNEVANVNESQMVELADGTLLLTMRAGADCKKGATSQDSGRTWSEKFDIPLLPDPACQSSVLRYTWPDEQGGKSRILFCNTGMPWDEVTRGRHTGMVRVSYDEGKTWPVSKILNDCKSFFGYSCLTVMPDGTIGCLFESAGCKNATLPSTGFDPKPYHITFMRFSLEWLTNGKDSLKQY